jgi:hypothetical protein
MTADDRSSGHVQGTRVLAVRLLGDLVIRRSGQRLRNRPQPSTDRAERARWLAVDRVNWGRVAVTAAVTRELIEQSWPHVAMP